MAEKSCACAGVEISTPVLLPGATTAVALHWTPKFDPADVPDDGVVRLWADLESKGGETQFRLEAVGTLRPALRVNLPRGRLDFGRLDRADLKAGAKEMALEIYAAEEKHKGFTLTAKSGTAGLKLSPPTPLPAERLAALGAVAGYRLTVAAGSALPTGRFRERLELATSVYPEPLEATVEGTVESGAVGMEPASFEVAAARLSLSKGYRTPPLKVALRYEPERTLVVQRVEPPLFAAAATPTKPNEWAIVLRLRPEADLRRDFTPAQLDEWMTFGFSGGAVVLATNHSQAPELRVPIGPGRLAR